MRITNETTVAATINTTVWPWVGAEITVTTTLGIVAHYPLQSVTDTI